MAKLPTFKRLTTSDFSPEDKQLIEQLGFSLNDGISQLYDALNKRLTFDENFLGSFRDVDVKVDANGNSLVSTFVTTGLSSSPRGLIVVKADNLTNSSIYPSSTPWLTWQATTTGIEILNVKGIPSNNSFKLRILILG